ncbi:MAG: phosphodiester glycosidase family protein, partial [Myxococcota bacterium]
ATAQSGHIAALDADLLFLDASSIVERGPSRVMVLRLNSPVELVPHHYRTAGLPGPMTADEWRKRLDAPVVFNAGQFDEDDEHLGWLKAEGQWISRLHREQWKALLVSSPREGASFSGIIDLEKTDDDAVERYRNVLQSMMLVDREKGIRVRASERTACRTVVAQDTQGRMLLILTEGAVTLSKLGQWLSETDLDIVRAMNLDGGLESQIAVHTDELSMTLYGQYGSGSEVFDAGAGALRRRVPAVIAVHPVKATTTQASR